MCFLDIKIQANSALPVLLMTAKTVFQVAIKSFHFPQTTPEGIKNNHSCFLEKSTWSSAPDLSQLFDHLKCYEKSFRRFFFFRKTSSASFPPSARNQVITVINLSCPVVLTTTILILLHVL